VHGQIHSGEPLVDELRAMKRFPTLKKWRKQTLMLQYDLTDIQGDQKVSVHLMITIQKVTSNVQSVPRQSPDTAWQPTARARGTLDPH
jgi:hypothetical protein